MNYDDFVIGTSNPEHPYNREQIEEEIFESDNLSECLNYSKLANDYEPLEAAIYNNDTIIENAISEIQFCIDCLQNNNLVKNRLLAVKRKLINTQIKRYE
jgi:hypothetical protein